MKVTVRIESELLHELKERARREKVSMTQLLNRLLRRGLSASDSSRQVPRFKEKTFPMGEPLINVEKALSIAAEMEDEEILRKMMLGK